MPRTFSRMEVAIEAAFILCLKRYCTEQIWGGSGHQESNHTTLKLSWYLKIIFPFLTLTRNIRFIFAKWNMVLLMFRSFLKINFTLSFISLFVKLMIQLNIPFWLTFVILILWVFGMAISAFDISNQLFWICKFMWKTYLLLILLMVPLNINTLTCLNYLGINLIGKECLRLS